MPFFDVEGAKSYLRLYHPGTVFTTTLGRGNTWEEVEQLLFQAARTLGVTVAPVPSRDQPTNPAERSYRVGTARAAE